MPMLEFATASSDDLFTKPDLGFVTGNRTTVAQELEVKLGRYEQKRGKVAKVSGIVRVQEALKDVVIAHQWEPPADEIAVPDAVDDIQDDELPDSVPIVATVDGDGVFSRSDRRRNGKPMTTAFDMLHKRSLDPAELSDADRAALIEIEQEIESQEVQYFAYVVDRHQGYVVWRPKLVPIPVPSRNWIATSGLKISGESDGYIMPDTILGTPGDIINERKPDPIRTYYAPGLGILEKLRHRAIEKAIQALEEFVKDMRELEQEIAKFKATGDLPDGIVKQARVVTNKKE